MIFLFQWENDRKYRGYQQYKRPNIQCLASARDPQSGIFYASLRPPEYSSYHMAGQRLFCTMTAWIFGIASVFFKCCRVKCKVLDQYQGKLADIQQFLRPAPQQTSERGWQPLVVLWGFLDSVWLFEIRESKSDGSASRGINKLVIFLTWYFVARSCFIHQTLARTKTKEETESFLTRKLAAWPENNVFHYFLSLGTWLIARARPSGSAMYGAWVQFGKILMRLPLIPAQLLCLPDRSTIHFTSHLLYSDFCIIEIPIRLQHIWECHDCSVCNLAAPMIYEEFFGEVWFVLEATRFDLSFSIYHAFFWWS